MGPRGPGVARCWVAARRQRVSCAHLWAPALCSLRSCCTSTTAPVTCNDARAMQAAQPRVPAVHTQWCTCRLLLHVAWRPYGMWPSHPPSTPQHHEAAVKAPAATPSRHIVPQRAWPQGVPLLQAGGRASAAGPELLPKRVLCRHEGVCHRADLRARRWDGLVQQQSGCGPADLRVSSAVSCTTQHMKHKCLDNVACCVRTAPPPANTCLQARRRC